MKYSEIKEMTTQELEETRVEQKLNLAKAKMTHAISPLENPLSIRDARRNVARLNFELRNREIEG